MSIGINTGVTVTLTTLNNDGLTISRKIEKASSDVIKTIAHAIGLVGAKEEDNYIFKNYNYENKLHRLESVADNDIIEIIDRDIINSRRPDLFEPIKVLADCLKIQKSIKELQAEQLEATDERSKEIDDEIIYLSGLCSIKEQLLTNNGINFVNDVGSSGSS